MDAAALQRRGYSVRALREMARRRLPRMVFDMVDGAAGDEITLRRNEAALAEIAFAPKLLSGAPRRDQSVELLGLKLPAPVIIGPTGLAGLLWPDAERVAARAAARFGTVYTTSHASTATIEEIGAAAAGPKWMQVFLFKDRGITAEFAARAKQAGYHGLVLTVDNQVTAGRDRDLRNGMTFPLRLSPRSVWDFASRPGWLLRMTKTPRPTFVNYGARGAGAGFGRLMAEQLDPAVGWRDVEWLRGQWPGPLLIKGLLHPDEARGAEQRGADAVIVSNHGGRQLDGAVASITALPAIVDAVGDKIPCTRRRRLPPRRRCGQGACAWRARRPDRQAASVGRRVRGRGRRALDARIVPPRNRSRHGARRLGRHFRARSPDSSPAVGPGRRLIAR